MDKGPLFVNCATLAAIIFGPFQPYVAVLIYIMFAIMQPNALWFYSLPPTFLGTPFGYSLIVGVMMLGGWILKSFGDWNIGKAALPMWLMLAYYLWALGNGLIIGVSPRGWYTLDLMFRLNLAMAVTLSLCNSFFRLRCFVWAVVFASGFVAFDLNQSYFSGFNRLQIIGYAGMDNNFYAVALVVGAGISFFTGLSERNIALKLLAFLSAALQAHAILFSMSRGGMLGLIIVGIAAFFVIRKTPMNLAFLFLGAVVGLSLAGDSVRERFSKSFAESEEDYDASAQSRIHSWRNCMIVIQENPLTGVGIQNWPSHAQARFGVFLEAHSTWFQAATETGIPGVTLQLGFIFITVWRVLPIARGKVPLQDESMRYYAQMVIATMAGYVISAQFVSLYCLEITYYSCLVGLCCIKLSHQLVQEQEQKERIDAILQLIAAEEEEAEAELEPVPA